MQRPQVDHVPILAGFRIDPFSVSRYPGTVASVGLDRIPRQPSTPDRSRPMCSCRSTRLPAGFLLSLRCSAASVPGANKSPNLTDHSAPIRARSTGRIRRSGRGRCPSKCPAAGRWPGPTRSIKYRNWHNSKPRQLPWPAVFSSRMRVLASPPVDPLHDRGEPVDDSVEPHRRRSMSCGPRGATTTPPSPKPIARCTSSTIASIDFLPQLRFRGCQVDQIGGVRDDLGQTRRPRGGPESHDRLGSIWGLATQRLAFLVKICRQPHPKFTARSTPPVQSSGDA